MSPRKRRYTFAAVVLLAFFTASLTGGCAYFKDWEHLPATKTDERTIYVVSHDWHTGIVVARDDLGSALQFIPTHLGDAAYYEFGWGDKAFYQTEKPTIGIMAKAVFLPTPSTMHVVAVPEAPAIQFPESETVQLHLSQTGLTNLTSGLASSFAMDANAQPVVGPKGLYGHSLFFDATGSYYISNTCNTWTVRMLALAGVPTTEWLTLTAGSAARQARWAAEKYVCCAEDAPTLTLPR